MFHKGLGNVLLQSGVLAFGFFFGVLFGSASFGCWLGVQEMGAMIRSVQPSEG